MPDVPSPASGAPGSRTRSGRARAAPPWRASSFVVGLVDGDGLDPGHASSSGFRIPARRRPRVDGQPQEPRRPRPAAPGAGRPPSSRSRAEATSAEEERRGQRPAERVRRTAAPSRRAQPIEPGHGERDEERRSRRRSRPRCRRTCREHEHAWRAPPAARWRARGVPAAGRSRAEPRGGTARRAPWRSRRAAPTVMNGGEAAQDGNDDEPASRTCRPPARTAPRPPARRTSRWRCTRFERDEVEEDRARQHVDARSRWRRPARARAAACAPGRAPRRQLAQPPTSRRTRRRPATSPPASAAGERAGRRARARRRARSDRVRRCRRRSPSDHDHDEQHRASGHVESAHERAAAEPHAAGR